MHLEPEDLDEPPPSNTRPYLAMGEEPNGTADPVDGGAVSRLRPYLLTSGRAEPVDHTLEIESQVNTTDLGVETFDSLSFERRDIVGLCVTTMSVAEVAARLKLHIGVARVLVADLARWATSMSSARASRFRKTRT